MVLLRLDKLLSQNGEISRAEAGRLIRAGLVRVDGDCVNNPSCKVNAEQSVVLLRGQRIGYAPYQYLMVNKPAGMVTAARDRSADTVMRLVPQSMQARDVMPVGRLDKDTTGLLLFTNNGTLAHRLLSPKRHVWKEYLVTVDGRLTAADSTAFASGIILQDFTAKPAELTILRASAAESQGIVRLREGKFHQVKRMFAARDLQVMALHRQSFGPLTLDIPRGQARTLQNKEIQALYDAAQMDREG